MTKIMCITFVFSEDDKNFLPKKAKTKKKYNSQKIKHLHNKNTQITAYNRRIFNLLTMCFLEKNCSKNPTKLEVSSKNVENFRYVNLSNNKLILKKK